MMMTTLLDPGVFLTGSMRSPQVMGETEQLLTVYLLLRIQIHLGRDTHCYSLRVKCF